MRFAVNLLLSLAMLALCLWLVWPNAHVQEQLRTTLRALEFRSFAPYVGGYVAILALSTWLRAYRWNNLLRPIGAALPLRRLMSVSAISFMAILALPARLGEFARPALLRKKGKVSATAVLGTVAVERIVDGLMVSLLVFFCCFSLRHNLTAPSWMMPTAYISLGVFTGALTFLVFALMWTDRTIRFCLTMSLLPRLAPKLAHKIDELLRKLISGFKALGDGRNLALFVLWSALYWASNGLGMWLLARGFALDLSVVGAFATMGLVAVGITLPNTPGLVGQFHVFTTMGLSLYLGKEVAQSTGLAYAITLHGIQVIWYLAAGTVAMAVTHVHWRDFVGQTVDDSSESPSTGEPVAP
jgi:hypothetical protein